MKHVCYKDSKKGAADELPRVASIMIQYREAVVFVESQTTPGELYTVRLVNPGRKPGRRSDGRSWWTQGSCTCASARYRSECKHGRAAGEALVARDFEARAIQLEAWRTLRAVGWSEAKLRFEWSRISNLSHGDRLVAARDFSHGFTRRRGWQP